jgi:hypothetical protein
MKKIAFLFLTITDVNFPNIWNKYFEGHNDKYSIYIHPKYPEQVTWYKDRIIENVQETGWGFIVKAYRELLKEAFKDKDNYKFITISDTCIPIQSFDNFYKAVTEDERSWIKLMVITEYKKKAILQNSSGNFIHHYARFCLNRDHVSTILDKTTELDFFEKMHIGDEYFLSVLYPLKNFRDFAVTYDDWDYTKDLYKKIKLKIKKLYEEQESNPNINNTDKIKNLQNYVNHIAGHPKLITHVKDDIDKILKCNSFFYRKFAPDSDIDKYWNHIIEYHNK